MNGSLLPQILFQLLLIACNAVFACAEIAILSVNDMKLAQLISKGDKRAARLARLTNKPAKFLATIQVAITLSGFLGSAFAADNFTGRLVVWLVDLGVDMDPDTMNTLMVIVITIILSYFTLVLGELVPKRIAMKKAEQLALGMSAFITLISKIFAPIVWLLTASTNGVLRLFGIDPNAQENDVTEEEIRMMVDVGSEKGAIDVAEKEFIQNIFEFDDITAGEITTHRTEIALLRIDETVEEWAATIHDNRHTFYPVCGKSVDDVIGVLNAKDYYRLNDKSRKNILAQAVKPAYFVPETVKADVLFKNMKKTRNYFAIVLDEYGGMSGIITMTDLLECIVGDLDDETDIENLPPAEIEVIDSNTWRISGSTPIDDAAAALNVTLDDDCDTFGGYVLGIIGSVPDDGTTVNIETDQLSVKITEIREHRIESTVVCLIKPDKEISLP